jgi:putative PIN family toxin of toxin-antitoxin system
MSRVVLDTNVYISALLFGGLPGDLLELAFLRAFTLIVSPDLLDELEEKLREKFGVSQEDVRLLRARLESVSQVVEPRERLSVIADDPDDDRVLECALAGEAEFIVSGDRHLLKLGGYQGISIITVRQFMEGAEVSQDEGQE